MTTTSKTAHRREEIVSKLDAAVRERFREEGIVDVKIDFDEDYDTTEDIVVVRIIFDSKAAELDSKKTVKLGSDLRSVLNDIDDYSFPLVRFISKADFDRF